MSDYGKTCLGRRPFQCSVLHFSDNAVRDLHFPTMVLPLFRECLALPVQLTLTSVPVAVAKAAVNKHPHKKKTARFGCRTCTFLISVECFHACAGR